MESVAECKCACANCGEVIQYRADQVGQITECRSCGEQSQLPQPAFKYCTTCGAQMPFLAPACVACATARKRKNLLFAVKLGGTSIAALAIAFVIWRLGKPKPVTTALPPTNGSTIFISQPRVHTPKSTNDLHPGAFTIQRKRGDTQMLAVGDIQNVSDNVHLRIRADVDVLDKNGAKIGTVTDYCVNLGAYQTWHFLAALDATNAVGLRFAGMTEE